MKSGKIKTFLYTVLFVLVLISAGCGKKTAVPTGPNIILITIDTLRADHLSCYGYHRQTSPFIDSIAGESVVFTNAYSTSSWTAPSMASIFTGHYPRSHGVLHGVARGPKAAVTGQEILVKDFLTIAEALKTAGYTTFGVSSNGHISRGTGFSQGFDYFATHWFMKSPAPHSSVNPRSPQVFPVDSLF
jgi:arylsulfatase A-like enzyme